MHDRSATSIRDLLQSALPADPDLEPGRTCDPSSDLARGRALRRRRRALMGSVPAAVLTAVVLVPALAQRQPTPSTATSPPATEVALVAYQGPQPPGYRVARTPDGWVVQGGDAFALTIARAADPDTVPSSFAGKLVVMLGSADAVPVDVNQLPPGYRKVEVGGRPGAVHTEQAASPAAAGPATDSFCATVTDAPGSSATVRAPASCTRTRTTAGSPTAPAQAASAGTRILDYQLDDGRWAVVQAPATLGWGASELVRFAEGVTVLQPAEAGRG